MEQGFCLAVAFAAGIGVGLFYFGGLWLTVRQLHRIRRPGLLILTSLAIRLSLSMAAFTLVMAGHWERLLVCVAGFLLMRTILVRRLGPVRRSLPAG
jgi:F1F0 ATPase subunit 2